MLNKHRMYVFNLPLKNDEKSKNGKRKIQLILPNEKVVKFLDAWVKTVDIK